MLYVDNPDEELELAESSSSSEDEDKIKRIDKVDKILSDMPEMDKSLIQQWFFEQKNSPKDFVGFKFKDFNEMNNTLHRAMTQFKHRFIDKKMIVQLDKDKNVIEVFENTNKAIKKLGRIRGSDNIKLCCDKKRKSAYGYYWRYNEKKD